MSEAIIMVCINITNFVLISKLENDHSMIEKHRLKNVVIFLQTNRKSIARVVLWSQIKFKIST